MADTISFIICGLYSNTRNDIDFVNYDSKECVNTEALICDEIEVLLIITMDFVA